jgi:hypothetical protein
MTTEPAMPEDHIDKMRQAFPEMSTEEVEAVLRDHRAVTSFVTKWLGDAVENTSVDLQNALVRYAAFTSLLAGVGE